MANLPELDEFTSGVYQLETTDKVEGGPDGISNLQAKQLANRTNHLKKRLDSGKFGRYTLNVAPTTAELDLAEQQVYRINADTAGTIDLSFANPPGANEAMTVVIKIKGDVSTINWPAGIVWNDQISPGLGAIYTTVVLLWDGEEWTGSVSSAA